MTTPANLIFIHSDNHNRQVTGCYGHTIVKTPTLDKLAARGVRFANSYSTSALCCPARAAMATGRYPHQTGYWDNAIAYDARIPTWMQRLREQGHTVTAIGKLHYRSSEQDNGFTEEIMPMHLHEGKGAIKNLLRGYDTDPPCTDGARWNLYAKRSGVGETHYQDYDRKITAHAIDWLRAHAADRGKPWTLKIGYISPHPPFFLPKRLYDLYPVVESAGANLTGADGDLPGISLFPSIGGREAPRTAFAEYHAQGSKTGQFMLREGNLKLIYHVGMPAQLFDLAADPDEAHDLVDEGRDGGRAESLETVLRAICDPEEVDRRAKADQRRMADFWGGPEKLRGADQILFTPPPGVTSSEAWAIPGAGRS